MSAVTANITAQNTFTSSISASYKNAQSALNLSISGTWVATVTLQRSFDGGTTWVDVETFGSNYEARIWEPEDGVIYRIGVKTGDFTSGTVKVRLSK